VIAEHVVDLDHFHIVDLGGGENVAGGFSAGDVRGRAELRVFPKSALYPILCPQAEEHWDENEKKIETHNSGKVVGEPEMTKETA
jgi:hypothetical protein